MLWPTLARGVKRAKTRAYGETIRVEVLILPVMSTGSRLTCDPLGNRTSGHCISPRLVCLSSWSLEVRAISATN
ncbi:hypothetical protein ACN42_g4717 [Penicillium freii]|uniref:Uncharacterized protein n=1 Tax=Penicillium freii TaxID=48697 RepID=A0A101MKW4_PENFR|nr:hypothetical protein ACN42_g4717 [Penicillium freii]